MTIINSTVLTAYNTGFQDLFTIDLVNDTNGSPGVPQYNSPGNQVAVTFSTLGDTVGTDASLDTVTGELTLAADITWIITVQVDQVGPGPVGTYYFGTSDGLSVIGLSQTLNRPLSVTVTPAIETVYQILALAPNWVTGGTWTYPARLSNVTLTVQAASGYTV